MSRPRAFGPAALLTACVGLLCIVCSVQAKIRLPAIISQGMVLQADKPVTLWGWGDPGESVTLQILATKVSTKAGADGQWRATLPPMKPAAGLTLRIVAGETIEISDVLVGEVWLASGQSNMAFLLRGAQNAETEIAAARYPQIRFFMARETFRQEPGEDVAGQWVACTPENAPAFSAVAYFFARNLHQKLAVPVGMVVSSVGGTRVETWMSAETLQADPVSRASLESWKSVTPAEFDRIAAKYRQFQHDRSAHAARAAEARKKGEAAPPAPVQPKKRCHDCPAALWNGMVAPLAGYSIRGFIWYQGESNTSAPERYDSLFPAMIQQWRGAWGDQALPFYFVQLANYAPPGGRGQYARLRESQRRALDVPHTGMAVTIDIGQADDIHPRNKQDVGYRLAQWALNRTYGQAVPASGPLFQAMTVKDGVAILRFSHVEGGLVAKGGPLNRFEIAGADSKFLPATAKIVAGTVHVRSDQVPAPVHVRYAWADDPSGCNLYNTAGLPASPFTTQSRKP